MFADSTLHRQVPGLQPKKLPHKQRGVSNPKNRSRPDLVGRILAQRAKRAEINASNQERLLPVQQSPASSHMSHTEADGRQRGNRPNIQPDSPHLHPQAPHPYPLEQAQQPGPAKDDSDSHHRDLYPSQQPRQTQRSGKELPKKVQMDAEEEEGQGRRREDISEPHSPLPPPAKRKVVFRNAVFSIILILLQKNQEAMDSEIEGALTELDANAEPPKKRQRAVMTNNRKRGASARKGKR